MREQGGGESWWRAVGVLATSIGVAAAVAPRQVTAVFGLPAAQLTGAADLGWRLFGVRTAVIGAGVLAGVPAARSVVIPVQLLDQVVFAHAARSGGVPLRTALLAALTSAGLIAAAVTGTRGPSPT